MHNAYRDAMGAGKSGLSVAIVGAGLAGAACAQALCQAGQRVQVFDKSRGPGGRLATRLLAWTGAAGQARTARLDHGAVSLTARTDSFRRFLSQAAQAGWVAPWTPTLATHSLALDDDGPHYVPVPEQPELCRRLLEGAATTWSSAIVAMHEQAAGWQLETAAGRLPEHHDAVLLALPPAQAAPLLAPHRRDWAQRASLALMQPCWTLMGVADAPRHAGPAWDLARPPEGALAWVMRCDSRPARKPVPAEAHWVLHARPGWSRRYLEQPPEWVLPRLQAELFGWLGQPVSWQHAVVHRWRYAQPQRHTGDPAGHCWWHAGRRLGVCGDFLGGTGAEGAWLSGSRLAAEIMESPHAA